MILARCCRDDTLRPSPRERPRDGFKSILTSPVSPSIEASSSSTIKYQHVAPRLTVKMERAIDSIFHTFRNPGAGQQRSRSIPDSKRNIRRLDGHAMLQAELFRLWINELTPASSGRPFITPPPKAKCRIPGWIEVQDTLRPHPAHFGLGRAQAAKLRSHTFRKVWRLSADHNQGTKGTYSERIGNVNSGKHDDTNRRGRIAWGAGNIPACLGTPSGADPAIARLESAQI